MKLKFIFYFQEPERMFPVSSFVLLSCVLFTDINKKEEKQLWEACTVQLLLLVLKLL